MNTSACAPELSRAQALQYRFAAYLRDPERTPPPPGIENRRMGVYRDLVYTSMESFIASNFPLIRSLYEDAPWAALARDFLREHRCHTPLFPEFGREFLRYLEMRQEQRRGDPPFLLELAHYEWAELALSLDETSIERVRHDPDGDPLAGVPVMSPLACVFAYRFPVHRIAPEFRPCEAPADPTLLLLVRGRDDTVRFHEINALSALLIERLRQNTQASGDECIEALIADYPDAITANLRDTGAAMLYQLKQCEAILGTLV
jgi:hypothetical protein